MSTQNQILLITDDDIIYNGLASTSLTIAHQPPTEGSYLKIDVSGGTSNTGTVVITGEYNGGSVEETVTFTAARWKITTNQFDTITTIVTSGLADEVTPPTLLIQSCNISGAPVSWRSVTAYYGIFQPQKSGIYQQISLMSAGLEAVTLYRVRFDTETDVSPKQRFCVIGYTGTFEVSSYPTQHIQLGTDFIDYTEFTAVKVSNTNEVVDVTEDISPSRYDADNDGIVDLAEETLRLRSTTEELGSADTGTIIVKDGRVYILTES